MVGPESQNYCGRTFDGIPVLGLGLRIPVCHQDLQVYCEIDRDIHGNG